MTYNVFGGTLNLAQLKSAVDLYVCVDRDHVITLPTD